MVSWKLQCDLPGRFEKKRKMWQSTRMLNKEIHLKKGYFAGTSKHSKDRGTKDGTVAEIKGSVPS
jgi:hypothetical protein